MAPASAPTSPASATSPTASKNAAKKAKLAALKAKLKMLEEKKAAEAAKHVVVLETDEIGGSPEPSLNGVPAGDRLSRNTDV